MTQAFVYRWTQQSTGKWYVGSRTAKNCHINDGYLCSSNTVKPLILENKNDWTREVLVIGEPKYIYAIESAYLQKYDARNDPMSFNMYNNNGDFTRIGMDGQKHTEETKKLLSEQKTGDKNPMFGKDSWNKGIKLGTSWYTDGVDSLMCAPGEEPDGYIPGRKSTWDIDDKRKWYTDGVDVLLFEVGTEPAGFELGGKNHWNKGKKYYTDGTDVKAFYPGTESIGFIPWKNDNHVSIGKKWYSNGIDSKMFFEGEEPSGYFAGMSHNQEKKKWYTSVTDTKKFIPGTEPDGYMPGRAKSEKKWFTDGILSNKFFPGEEPTGYRLGRKIQNAVGKKAGKRYYNNGKKIKMCTPGEEPTGYTLGRLSRKK